MRTPIVREIREAEYLRLRREMTAGEQALQRARVTRALIVGRAELRDVYPRRRAR
jgi:hypothetical protein